MPRIADSGQGSVLTGLLIYQKYKFFVTVKLINRKSYAKTRTQPFALYTKVLYISSRVM